MNGLVLRSVYVSPLSSDDQIRSIVVTHPGRHRRRAAQRQLWNFRFPSRNPQVVSKPSSFLLSDCLSHSLTQTLAEARSRCPSGSWCQLAQCSRAMCNLTAPTAPDRQHLDRDGICISSEASGTPWACSRSSAARSARRRRCASSWCEYPRPFIAMLE